MFNRLRDALKVLRAPSPRAMKRKRAQRRLREIWRNEHPGCATIEETFRTPEPWKWFNIYANLQNHDQTIETVAAAFTESFERRAKEKHHLEEIIVRERAELRKRLAEIEKLKAQLAAMQDTLEHEREP